MTYCRRIDCQQSYLTIHIPPNCSIHIYISKFVAFFSVRHRKTVSSTRETNYFRLSKNVSKSSTGLAAGAGEAAAGGAGGESPKGSKGSAAAGGGVDRSAGTKGAGEAGAGVGAPIERRSISSLRAATFEFDVSAGVSSISSKETSAFFDGSLNRSE